MFRILHRKPSIILTSLTNKVGLCSEKIVAESFFKRANLASFCLFSSFSHYNFNNTNWKKCRWCGWDLNLRLQDCGRKRSHGAIAPALLAQLFTLFERRKLKKESGNGTFGVKNFCLILNNLSSTRKRLLLQSRQPSAKHRIRARLKVERMFSNANMQLAILEQVLREVSSNRMLLSHKNNKNGLFWCLDLLKNVNQLMFFKKITHSKVVGHF